MLEEDEFRTEADIEENLQETVYSFNYLEQTSSATIGICSSECPCISMISKNHEPSNGFNFSDQKVFSIFTELPFVI